MNPDNRYAFNSPSIQRSLNLFVFLLAFPGVEILGNSLYFYIFLWILYRTQRRTGRFFLRSRFGMLLVLSWIFGLLSTLLHPPLIDDTNAQAGMAMMVLRYAYWFAIGAYFYSWFREINLIQLSKWISIGYLVQVLGFYILSFEIDATVFSIDTSLSRNGFVFNSILFSGVLLYYFLLKYGRKAFWPVAVFILLNLVFTNGRAGAVVGLFIVLVNFALLTPGIRRLSKLILLLLITLFFVTRDIETTIYRYGNAVAPIVEPMSPRFASLLRGVDEGDLDRDKSWLIRELMVDKSIDILREHPFLGVGYGNFSNYQADLPTFSSIKYVRLRGHSNEYYNTRSGHNSYVNHLGETGLIGFGILLVLILPILWWFLSHYWNGSFFRYGRDAILLIGLVGALIHGYAISAFTGANLWFMLGIGTAIIRNRK